MQLRPDNPVIVQGDGKVLVETQHPRYEDVRDFLGRFAELEASPELLHTYRITPLSLWNAASAGLEKTGIIAGLRQWSKFDVPPDVLQTIEDTIERYGLRLSEDSWHGATADATITGQLFLAQMNKYEALRDIAPDQLGDSIETWREQQEADFQAWLAMKRAEES